MRRCGRALAVERDVRHAARSRSAISSTGVRNLSRFRGRSLSSAATQSRSSALWMERSVPFGKYWRRGRWCSRWCPLPGRVRIAEEDVDAGGDGDLFPVPHLRSLVPGHTPAASRAGSRSSRPRRRGPARGCSRRAGAPAWCSRWSAPPGCRSRSGSSADDQVTLPVTVHGPVFDVAGRSAMSAMSGIRFLGWPAFREGRRSPRPVRKDRVRSRFEPPREGRYSDW